MSDNKLAWRTSSYSGTQGGNCIEVAERGGMILVRDTKDHGHGSVHRFTAAEWRRFTEQVKRSLAFDPKPRADWHLMESRALQRHDDLDPLLVVTMEPAVQRREHGAGGSGNSIHQQQWSPLFIGGSTAVRSGPDGTVGRAAMEPTVRR